MASKFCMTCGAELQPGAKFCLGCGTPAEQPLPPAQEPQQFAPPEPVMPPPAPLPPVPPAQGYGYQQQYAPPPVPPPMQPAPPPPAEKVKPGAGTYFFYLLLTGFPALGLVFAFLWGMGKKQPPSQRRNLARAMIVYNLIFTVLLAVFFIGALVLHSKGLEFSIQMFNAEIKIL